MSGLIAIVGRPNVGKSALFNRIVGRRIAIVHDMPGVTRDRISAEAEWEGRRFSLVDTGGIGLTPGKKAVDVLTRVALEQVDLAVEAAHVIVFVVSVLDRLLPLDESIAVKLRQSGKRVIVAVNKVDTAEHETDLDEFSRLGFDDVFAISAVHKRGISDLTTSAVSYLPEDDSTGISGEDGEEAEPFKLAIVGRPNVGKSSIINALTKSERVIVSPIPGTTRDAVDVPFTVETDGKREDYMLIDTAGMRKKSRVSDTVEFFSVARTQSSIERCDLAILVIDADEGIGEQDKKIADHITKNFKSCIIVVNKWDLMEKAVNKAQKEHRAKRLAKEHTAKGTAEVKTSLGDFGAWVQEQLFFLNYAPVIFTSAETGFQLDRLLEAVRYVQAQLEQSIPTSLINRCIRDAVDRKPYSSKTGARMKFFYATQIRKAPPSFVLFVNSKEHRDDSYDRFLIGEIRKAFGYEGCPIRLVLREKTRKVAPIRSRQKAAKKRPSANKSSSPGQ